MSIKLISIEKDSHVPKYEQIKRNITRAVELKKLRRGDKLPSLQRVKNEFNVSINTVVRAYDELKRQGIIDSVNGKGFHIASESTNHVLTVFLLFDELNLFKQDLYNSFKDTLGDNFKIDIFFHHYNFKVYESLVLDHISQYEMFVIIPPPDPAAERVLERLEPEQVLILDQKHFFRDRYPFIVQDFAGEVYDSLQQGVELLEKYQVLSLIKPSLVSNADLPVFTNLRAEGLKKFSKDHSFECQIHDNFDFSAIKSGHVYFIISDDDLVEIIKSANSKNLKIGTDIGIVSFNDNKLKEVIEGGITTISTDFRKMGKTAAECILYKTKINEVNPASLLIRKSL